MNFQQNNPGSNGPNEPQEEKMAHRSIQQVRDSFAHHHQSNSMGQNFGQKSQRINGNKSINITSRGDSSQSNGVNQSLLQDYQNYQRNFNSRQSIGGGTKNFQQMQGLQKQHSGFQQPQIIQNHQNLIRSSNQYLNKENVEMRSTSGHMSQGYNSSQHDAQQLLMNKTTSFLHAATLNGNASTKNSQVQMNNFVAHSSGQYMTQSQQREFNGRDISNIQADTIKSQKLGNNSRIPQPSIINSATGHMNNAQMDQENIFMQPRTVKNEALQNPMIISKHMSQKTNQTSHRYLSKDGASKISQGVLKNGAQPIRKLSHGDVSAQQNLFKRLRQTGANSGTGLNTRYSVAHQPNSGTGIRIDKRLEQPIQQQNSSNIMNKYAHLHQNAHEANKISGGLMNSTVNKSGQNLGIKKSGVLQTTRASQQSSTIGNSTSRLDNSSIMKLSATSKMTDKENKHKMSNKAFQSIEPQVQSRQSVPAMGKINQLPLQSKQSSANTYKQGSQRSGSSQQEMEQCSSHNTSQRNSQMLQHKSISGQSKSQGRVSQQNSGQNQKQFQSSYMKPAEFLQINKEQAMVVDQVVQQIQPPTCLINKGSESLGFKKFDEEKLQAIVDEMENRRKQWLREYKTKLDLNDVLEIRNPQAVVEFVPEIMENMRKEEERHMYPSNFLADKNFQSEISDKYRQYLVDWLAELHYKFKMWPETLYVTVGIIDKTLMRWQNFKKADLQCLGITALHIAGKYEEIYPQELKTILHVIDNAVTRTQVCKLETKILECLDFDMVWPSILRFMQRYAFIANLNKEQEMTAQMFCDFILLNMSLLRKKPSVLGAVAIYCTNKILDKKPWSADMVKCSGGIKEQELKPLANELFYYIKKLESSSLKTMFRKYESAQYLEVAKVISRIEMPGQSAPEPAQQ